MDSNIGLIIQLLGTTMVSVLLFILRKSIRSATLDYWAWAWGFLSAGLFLLTLAFSHKFIPQVSVRGFLLGEYIFGLLLIAGCLNLKSGFRLKLKHCWAAGCALLAAILVPLLDEDFNRYFSLHSFIMAALFGTAFLLLRPDSEIREKNFGRVVLRFSLAALSFVFFNYFILFLTRVSYPLIDLYLPYNSIFDLIVENLMGFGMIIVLLEQTRIDVEQANRRLKEAHEKLEKISQVDPLTTAFNRHAFQVFLNKNGKANEQISGCVGVFDIDNLKPINDRHGHAIGDLAIRSVSGSIRSLIRSDDLLFRWGGDEFFVILIGMEKKMAQERFGSLDYILENIRFGSQGEMISVGVSFGFANFESVSELEVAVKLADEEMYKAKQLRKNTSAIQSSGQPNPLGLVA